MASKAWIGLLIGALVFSAGNVSAKDKDKDDKDKPPKEKTSAPKHAGPEKPKAKAEPKQKKDGEKKSGPKKPPGADGDGTAKHDGKDPSKGFGGGQDPQPLKRGVPLAGIHPTPAPPARPPGVVGPTGQPGTPPPERLKHAHPTEKYTAYELAEEPQVIVLTAEQFARDMGAIGLSSRYQGQKIAVSGRVLTKKIEKGLFFEDEIALVLKTSKGKNGPRFLLESWETDKGRTLGAGSQVVLHCPGPKSNLLDNVVKNCVLQ